MKGLRAARGLAQPAPVRRATKAARPASTSVPPWRSREPLLPTAKKPAPKLRHEGRIGGVEDGAALFVRGFSRFAKEADVRKAFEKVCEVRDARLPVDVLGRGRGFAIVTTVSGDRSDAEAVIDKMHATALGGFQITVEIYEAKAARPPRPRPCPPDAVAAVVLAVRLNHAINECKAASDVLALFGARGKDFSPVNLATVLQRLGALPGSAQSSSTRAALRALAARAAASVVDDGPQWQERGLANAAWGAAKAGVEAKPLFEAIAFEAPKRIAAFIPQNLANTAWAFAKAGVEAPLLFEAIADEAVAKMDTFHEQALIDTQWAFETAKVGASTLFQALAEVRPPDAAERPA